MTAPRRTALLVGATGLVGGHCLRMLLADDAWSQVVVLARRRLPASHPKLVARLVDFDRLGQLSGFPRVTDVFCALGTTIARAGSRPEFYKVDFTYVAETARLASVSGARQFLLVSALGADPVSNIFYSRVKGEAEEAVKKLPLAAIQIFRPSLLSGERMEARPLERVGVAVFSALSFAMVGPLRRYRPVAAADVARAMLEVARRESPGTHVYDPERIEELAGTGAA
ncbi:MAG TPA: oxidoreductase [Thermoanaerobaculia bacterium]|nr:oxidoreductase [Thermoanaerobaculia bacterium]